MDAVYKQLMDELDMNGAAFELSAHSKSQVRIQLRPFFEGSVDLLKRMKRILEEAASIDPSILTSSESVLVGLKQADLDHHMLRYARMASTIVAKQVEKTKPNTTLGLTVEELFTHSAKNTGDVFRGLTGNLSWFEKSAIGVITNARGGQNNDGDDSRADDYSTSDMRRRRGRPPGKLGGIRGHPDMPKKPVCPNFRYMFMNLKKYRKDHPEIPLTEARSLLARQFHTLPEPLKGKYKKEYENDMEKWHMAKRQLLFHPTRRAMENKEMKVEESESKIYRENEREDPRKAARRYMPSLVVPEGVELKNDITPGRKKMEEDSLSEDSFDSDDTKNGNN